MAVFLRTGSKRYKRLGRKKILKWRRPRGRHNKIRERKRSRPLRVQIGYRTRKDERNKINGKSVSRIKNIMEIEKMNKGEAVIIGKVGKRKREIILNKAKEKGLVALNFREDKP
ncbi:50S ribosomal protein L32e [archaeon]|nr:50S ribosomal protein L32e [archaeon]